MYALSNEIIFLIYNYLTPQALGKISQTSKQHNQLVTTYSLLEIPSIKRDNFSDEQSKKISAKLRYIRNVQLIYFYLLDHHPDLIEQLKHIGSSVDTELTLCCLGDDLLKFKSKFKRQATMYFQFLLKFAALCGAKEIYHYLLENKAESPTVDTMNLAILSQGSWPIDTMLNNIEANNSTLNCAVRTKDLQLIEKILNKNTIVPDNAIYAAALATQDPEIIKRIKNANQKVLLDSLSFDPLCTVKNLNYLQSLLNKYKLQLAPYILRLAAKYNNLDFYQYLLDKGQKPDINTLKEFIKHSNLAKTKEVVENYLQNEQKPFYSLPIPQTIEIFNYLRKTGCITVNKQYLKRVIADDCITVFNHAVKVLSMTPDAATLQLALSLGSANIVMCLLKKHQVKPNQGMLTTIKQMLPTEFYDAQINVWQTHINNSQNPNTLFSSNVTSKISHNLDTSEQPYNQPHS